MRKKLRNYAEKVPVERRRQEGRNIEKKRVGEREREREREVAGKFDRSAKSNLRVQYLNARKRERRGDRVMRHSSLLRNSSANQVVATLQGKKGKREERRKRREEEDSRDYPL